MLAKVWRAFFSTPQVTITTTRIHESGQIAAVLSTQEMERKRLYERIAQHQRLIEVEEDLRQRY